MDVVAGGVGADRGATVLGVLNWLAEQNALRLITPSTNGYVYLRIGYVYLTCKDATTTYTTCLCTDVARDQDGPLRLERQPQVLYMSPQDYIPKYLVRTLDPAPGFPVRMCSVRSDAIVHERPLPSKHTRAYGTPNVRAMKRKGGVQYSQALLRVRLLCAWMLPVTYTLLHPFA